MTRAVVFDVGKVLVDWDSRYLYEKLIDDPDELDWFTTHVVNLEWHTEHDRGKPMAQGVAELCTRHPDHRHLIEAFPERFLETMGPVIEGTVEIVRELSAKGVPLFALTNFNAEAFPEFCERHDYMALFEDIVVSGVEGVIKPDPEIYSIAETRFGHAPEDLIFVDDRLENIRAAETRRWTGIHFTGADALSRDLNRLRVL